VVAVGIGLGIAGIALVWFVRASLRDDVRAEAELRARSIGRELARDGTFTPGDPDEEFAQVLAADGSVVAASPNVRGVAAVVSIAPGEERVLDEAPVEDGPALVVASQTGLRGERVTVVVGRSLEAVTEATAAMLAVMAVAVPALLAVVGFITWLVVGRALAPVDAMRREVDAISTGELHRRVDEPPGDDEIVRLARTMNAMLERLHEGHRRERRLVSDASHELRSPISSIRQHEEVARSHPDTTTAAELASVVLEEGERLQRIVEDLLLLSGLDEGSLRIRTEPVDLDDIVLHEAKRLRTSTSLRVETDGVSAGRVRGDRAKLERLVRNLTENAARHARGVVALSLREEAGRVLLVVEDDGPGVPVDERERIFERFVRLDEARDRDSGGSGLGLAIVHDLAVAHGGTASVTDGPLGGARFEVRIPTMPEAPPAPTHRSASFSEGSGPGRQDRREPDEVPGSEPRRQR
jgi:signal transduction histidine kinase